MNNFFAIKDGGKVKGIEPQAGIIMEDGLSRLCANVVGQHPLAFLMAQDREVVTLGSYHAFTCGSY